MKASQQFTTIDDTLPKKLLTEEEYGQMVKEIRGEIERLREMSR